MYSNPSKTPTGKNFKGSVSILTSNNRLQLRFRYGGRRHYISLGLPDSPDSRKFAEMRAREIELDILSGHFDETLARYKPQAALSTVSPDITPTVTPKLNELWTAFVEYKRPQCSPSTMHRQYGVHTRYIEKFPTHDLSEATQIRDHILETIPIGSAKRLVTRISACCNWAVSSGKITQNPFDSMASKIKLPKANGEGMNEIDPFTAEERDMVLDAIANNQFCSKSARVKHSFYHPFLFFLFNTGCRPSEAIALQWKHIQNDERLILFEQSTVMSEHGLVQKQGLKTQDRRKFPCNGKLRQFLKEIKPEDCSLESLVFPSPTGKWIDIHNFRNRIWKPVIDGLGVTYRKPYQTRHTFITLALENGLDAKDVARLVGNSPEVIYQHYAGNKRELFVPEF